MFGINRMLLYVGMENYCCEEYKQVLIGFLFDSAEVYLDFTENN